MDAISDLQKIWMPGIEAMHWMLDIHFPILVDPGTGRDNSIGLVKMPRLRYNEDRNLLLRSGNGSTGVWKFI